MFLIVPDNTFPYLFMLRIMGEGLVVRYETLFLLRTYVAC